MIRISSKHDGFRRCGMAHSAQPTDHEADRFSEEEIEILQAEPMLVVTMVDGADPQPVEFTQAQIIEAIKTLDTATDALWTKSGKPQVEAIEDALGEGADIKAAQRDEAWVAMNNTSTGD